MVVERSYSFKEKHSAANRHKIAGSSLNVHEQMILIAIELWPCHEINFVAGDQKSKTMAGETVEMIIIFPLQKNRPIWQ